MPIPAYKDYYPYILKHADKDKSANEYLEIVDEDSIQSLKNLLKGNGIFQGLTFWVILNIFR